jgi:hypothetical protein
VRQDFAKNGIFAPSPPDETILLLFAHLAPSTVQIDSIQTTNDVASVSWSIALKRTFEYGPLTLSPGQRLEFHSSLKRSNNVWLIERL